MSDRQKDSGLRLQLFLARAGLGSRREAEGIILQGRVRVDGKRVTEMGLRIDPERAKVEVDGRLVKEAKPRWAIFHKPPGVLTTRSDTHGRETVYDVLPPEFHGLAYLGRLDMDSEGLLIFTNQGDLSKRLLDPQSGIEREYRVWVEGSPDRKVLARLQRGIRLEDGIAKAADAGYIRSMKGRSLLKLTLKEGRKREIRRLCEAVGYPVHRLIRIRFGTVRLAGLDTGDWRILESGEVKELLRLLPGRSGTRERQPPKKPDNRRKSRKNQPRNRGN